MAGSQDRGTDLRRRVVSARLAYGVLSLLALAGLAIASRGAAPRHLLACAAIVAVALGGEAATYELKIRETRVFNMDIGLALLAAVLGGPLAGLAVFLIPELVYLARRREAFWNLGLVANLASYAALAAAGALVLRAIPTAGVLAPVRLIAAGSAMLAVNYVFARLVLATVRDGARPRDLIHAEVVGVLPLELLSLGMGVIAALLMPAVGILALAGFATLVFVPQLAAARLTRARSAARLSVDAAAAVYRDALADELGLRGEDRRYAHTIDALVQRRPLHGAPANPLAAATDALAVTLCLARPERSLEHLLSARAQVVLVARGWAELTARCTPALSHPEALLTLGEGPLGRRAPAALAAAARVAARERALTPAIAALPCLYRAPLPRRVRRDALPRALARLTAPARPAGAPAGA